jgi:hypothetical protein
VQEVVGRADWTSGGNLGSHVAAQLQRRGRRCPPDPRRLQRGAGGTPTMGCALTLNACHPRFLQIKYLPLESNESGVLNRAPLRWSVGLTGPPALRSVLSLPTSLARASGAPP